MQMKVLRFLLKAMLFPVTLTLTLIVMIARLLTAFSAVAMNIIASVLFLLGICMMIFLQAPLSELWKPFFVGWLLCPYGIPLIAGFLVEMVGIANDALKSI